MGVRNAYGNMSTLTQYRHSVKGNGVASKARPYMGSALLQSVSQLNIRPERKIQIYKAFIDFYSKSKQHRYVKEQLIHPNRNDLAAGVKEQDLVLGSKVIKVKGYHHTSLNIDRGSRELPIILSVIDQLNMNHNPRTVYAPTYTIQDVKGWQVPQALRDHLYKTTPKEIQERPSGWITKRQRGDNIHQPFVTLASYNIMQLCKDFQFKKGSRSLSCNDMRGAKLLTSLDQADGHNIAVRIVFGNALNANGKMNVSIDVIDSVKKDSSFKRRPGQDYDYQHTLKKIVQYYVSQMLPDQEYQKLDFKDIHTQYTATQIGGYCVFHAQKATLHPPGRAVTNEDYALELQWISKNLRKLRQIMEPGIRQEHQYAKQVYDHLGKIRDAIDVDTRRVYFNDAALFHRGNVLPVLPTEGRNKSAEVSLKHPRLLAKGLKKYAQFKMGPDALVSHEYEKMLHSRAVLANDAAKVTPKNLSR